MGSSYFVANPTVRLAQIDMKVCLDLVGHTFGPPDLPAEVRDTILIMGAETNPEAMWGSTCSDPRTPQATTSARLSRPANGAAAWGLCRRTRYASH